MTRIIKHLKARRSFGSKLMLVFLLGVLVGSAGLMIALKLFTPAPVVYRQAPPSYGPGGSFKMIPPAPPTTAAPSTKPPEGKK